MNLEDFQYLWDSGNRFVLVDLAAAETVRPDRLAIYDTIEATAVLIDDDGLSEQVVSNMLLRGVPVVRGLPR